MPTQIELIQEAARRGILPEDKKPLYDEAVRRGLVAPATPPAAPSSAVPAAPPPKADSMGAYTDANGQKYIEPVHFGENYATEEDKIKALKEGGFGKLVTQSLADTGNQAIAGPVNALSRAGSNILSGVGDTLLRVAGKPDAAAAFTKSIPQVRTNDAVEAAIGDTIPYVVGGGAGMKLAEKALPAVTQGSGLLARAFNYLGRSAGGAGGVAAVTNPDTAVDLGNVVGGPTEILPEDSGGMKKLKMGAETMLTGGVVDAAAKGASKVGNLARAFLGPEDPAAAQATLDAFKRQNIEPPAAAIAQNPTLTNADRALSSLPTSANTMKAQAERVIGDQAPMAGKSNIKERVADIVAGKSSSSIDAGKAIQEGSQDFVDNFKTQAANRFAAFDSKMTPDQPVDLANTRQIIDTIRKTPEAKDIAERISNPTMKSLITDIAEVTPPTTQQVKTGVVDVYGQPVMKNVVTPGKGGSTSWEAATELRNYIGKAIGDPKVLPDIPTGELKRMYGSLTDDMRKAVEAKSPNLLAEFDSNNDFYKSGIASIDRTAGNYVTKDRAGVYTQTPEDVYKKSMAGSKERATEWRALRSQLPEDKWEVVQAEEIRKMGVAGEGAQNAAGDRFSVNTYLTNWNKLNPAEKDALFGGTKYASMRKDLDDLAKINESLKDVSRFKNTSNTAPQNWFMHILAGGGVGSAILGSTTGFMSGLVASSGLPYATSKLMTSPGFVKWLVQGSKQITRNPSLIPGHIARLAGIADAEPNPEVKKDIQEYGKAATKQYQQDYDKGGKPKAPGPQSSLVKPELIKAIGHLESSGNPQARGDGSSAFGMHQFTDDTWKRMVNKYGKETGITLADRGNGKKSEIMAQKYAEDNAAQLRNNLGRDPTDAEIYMAHVLGAGGAARLVREYSSGKTAAELFPAAAKVSGNKKLFYNGKVAKTVPEFYAYLANKIATAQSA